MAKTKGGGTKKVCLPAAKVRSMSKAEKEKALTQAIIRQGWKLVEDK